MGTNFAEEAPNLKLTKKERTALLQENLATIQNSQNLSVPRICIDLSFGHLMSEKVISCVFLVKMAQASEKDLQNPWLRARTALMLFKDVPLKTRRTLSP